MSVTRQSDTQQTAIGVRSVSQVFDGVTVLDDVDLDIVAGRATALVGPNGAGKSTLMNVMAGSQRPTHGSVLHAGRDITKAPPHARARMGILRTFQLPSDFGRLTVLENLLVGASNEIGNTVGSSFLRRRIRWQPAEIAAVARARELLDEFGLRAQESDRAGELSGGQRRIVELLRVVMANPSVLLLDEPFAGLHPSIIEKLGRFIGDLGAAGVTVIMIAHELDAVEAICERVVVMARGAVLFEGSMADARQDEGVVNAYVAG